MSEAERRRVEPADVPKRASPASTAPSSALSSCSSSESFKQPPGDNQQQHEALELARVAVARSQSLTTTVFTNAKRATGKSDVFATAPVSVPGVLLADVEDVRDEVDEALTRQQRARYSRRAMSDEFSLSLLQEELGYPRRKLSRNVGHGPGGRGSLLDKRPRGGSLIEDRSGSGSGDALVASRSNNSSHGSSSASSASGSVENSPNRRRHSLPEPEAEEIRQFRWSMASTAYAGSSSDRNSLYEDEEQRKQEEEGATSKIARKGRNSGQQNSQRHRQSNADHCNIHQEADCESQDDDQNNTNEGEEDDDVDSLSVGEEEENFMDYRVASVTGYSRDADGVVYYEVIVRSTAYGPLSAYKVRRRYSEFKELHHALSKIMTVSTTRLPSISSMGYHHRSNDDDTASDSGTRVVGFRHSSADILDNLESDEEVTLPPLPDKGGLWSYLQFDSIPLLEKRAKYFHAILMAAQQHPGARRSRLINEFVGTPPDLVALHSSLANSYVSLHRFAAPRLSISVEVQERKQKARRIRLRRSSLTQRNSLPSNAGL